MVTSNFDTGLKVCWSVPCRRCVGASVCGYVGRIVAWSHGEAVMRANRDAAAGDLPRGRRGHYAASELEFVWGWEGAHGFFIVAEELEAAETSAVDE